MRAKCLEKAVSAMPLPYSHRPLPIPGTSMKPKTRGGHRYKKARNLKTISKFQSKLSQRKMTLGPSTNVIFDGTEDEEKATKMSARSVVQSNLTLRMEDKELLLSRITKLKPKKTPKRSDGKGASKGQSALFIDHGLK
eukprot:gnl/Carplike_NY0171/5369_a7326_260.p1 GENE.gnl/Carplike_NY0171/5369_a7326_260~~gnl/Carplike_NY0171/5369_a7326_260.p1  ORF type:complete len:155 (-),score=21.79 gnl/Carplike_NY0171/5369_a7326_260:36-449(-)